MFENLKGLAGKSVGTAIKKSDFSDVFYEFDGREMEINGHICKGITTTKDIKVFSSEGQMQTTKIPKGTIGGYIEQPRNLRREAGSEAYPWIGNGCVIYGNSIIRNTTVQGDTIIYGNCRITDSFIQGKHVIKNAKMSECALFGDLVIEGVLEKDSSNIIKNTYINAVGNIYKYFDINQSYITGKLELVGDTYIDRCTLEESEVKGVGLFIGNVTTSPCSELVVNKGSLFGGVTLKGKTEVISSDIGTKRGLKLLGNIAFLDCGAFDVDGKADGFLRLYNEEHLKCVFSKVTKALD